MSNVLKRHLLLATATRLNSQGHHPYNPPKRDDVAKALGQVAAIAAELSTCLTDADIDDVLRRFKFIGEGR